MRGARFEEVLRNCREGTPLELTPEELAEGWHYCPEFRGQLAMQKTVGRMPWCGCTSMSSPPGSAWEIFLKDVSGWAPCPFSIAATACLAELDKLRGLLNRSRHYVESDVQMMADITRFSPLSPEDQAKHDTTEFPSEVLLRDIDALGLT